jgi:hypothetical protein
MGTSSAVLTRHTTEPCLWGFREVCRTPSRPKPLHANHPAPHSIVRHFRHLGLRFARLALLPPSIHLPRTSPGCCMFRVNIAAGDERFQQRGTRSLRPTTVATVIKRCIGCRTPAVVDIHAKQGRSSSSSARWAGLPLNGESSVRNVGACRNASGCSAVLHLSARGASVRWLGVRVRLEAGNGSQSGSLSLTSHSTPVLVLAPGQITRSPRAARPYLACGHSSGFSHTRWEPVHVWSGASR